VQFNEENSPSLIRIRGLRDHAIEVQFPRRLLQDDEPASRWLEPSFFISPDHFSQTWPSLRLQDLALPHIQALAAMQPEVVLLGSGAQLEFPGRELTELLQQTFMGRGIGVEFMNNESACRTYNILMHEGRNVVAALLK